MNETPQQCVCEKKKNKIESLRIKVLDNYVGSFQEVTADTWREKFSNVNVAMRNVNISL